MSFKLENLVGTKPLPKNLSLQMDNYVKITIIVTCLHFLLLITSWKLFEEVQLRFLVVGHTHKDIDGSFGYLSKMLHEQNTYILANLMQGFMISQDWPSVLQFIQKILNLKDGFETLMGHSNMHLFHFFVYSNKWPIM